MSRSSPHSRPWYFAVAILAFVAGPTNALAIDGAPLFRLDGFDYRLEELSPADRQSIFEADRERYQAVLRIIDEAVFKVFVEQQAKENSTDPEKVRAKLLQFEPPTDAAVDAFYESNRDRIQAPLEQVRDRIKQFLTQQQMQSRQTEIVEEIKSRGKFELLVRAPIAPYVEIETDSYPFKGAADASVIVVEYADFQCPHCKRASHIMQQVMDKYGSRVKLIYKDYPVNRSGISRLVARGAVCADEQGRFWDYHDLAFDRQETLTRESPMALAEALSLDKNAFEECFEGPDSEEKIVRSEAESRRFGLSGTPTFFVNGRQLIIEDLERDLMGAIESALEESG